MKRSGTTIAVLSLFLGVFIGACILGAKWYAGKALANYLDGEIKKSTEGWFAYDDIAISLLTLRAEAKNARIETSSGTALKVETLEAWFSLRKIFDRIIDLSHLRMANVLVRDAAPGSATYQFIDYLAQPVPPERDHPDRWKLKLQKLTVEEGTVEQPVQGKSLLAQGVHFAMTRRTPEDFLFSPSIRRLSFPPTAQSEAIDLGSVSASFYTTGDLLVFERAALTQEKSNIIEYTGELSLGSSERIEGKLRYSLPPSLHSRWSTLSGMLHGEGTVSGSISQPKVAGTVRADALEGSLLPVDWLPVPAIVAEYEVRHLDSTPEIAISQLTLPDSPLELELQETIIVSTTALEGEGSLLLRPTETNTLPFESLRAEVSLTGKANSPEISLDGEIKKLLVEGYLFPPLDLDLQYREQSTEFSLRKRKGADGQASLTGELAHTSTEGISLKNTDVTIEGLRLSGDPHTKDARKFIELFASGNLQGPLDIAQLSGQAEIDLQYVAPVEEYSFRVGGQTALTNGHMKAHLENSAQTLLADIDADFSKEKNIRLLIKLADLSPADFGIPAGCSRVQGDITYTSSLKNLLAGAGRLAFEELSIGCSPYTLTLPRPVELPLRDGTIELDKLALRGAGSALQSSGSVSFQSGYDATVQGEVQLNSFAQLLPGVDDMRGKAKVNVDITGNFEKPVLAGSIALDQARLSHRPSGLTAERVEGNINLQNTSLLFENLGGMLNGGDFDIHGAIHLDDSDTSDARVQFKNVYLAPTNEIGATVSGSLGFQNKGDGRQTLSGEITVNQGEFVRSLDVITLLQEASANLLGTEEALEPQVDASNGGFSPQLDVTIRIPNNLFVISNWFSAELQGDLTIRGELDEPLFEGQIQTLSGWFGFRNQRFDVTSGRLTFSPQFVAPTLTLTAETFAFSREGGNVLIFLEASGPITDPSVTLSSDRNLSQEELYRLLASGYSPNDTFSSSAGGGVNGLGATAPDGYLLDDALELDFRSFLLRLAKIDELGIEPAYNPLRGQVEPTFVATKRLSQNLRLIGQSFLSGSTGNTAAALFKAEYDLPFQAQLIGIADSVTSEDQTALGIDLKTTLVSRDEADLDVTITGGDSFYRSQLLQAARIHDRSRLQQEDLDGVREKLLSFYRREGFYQAAIRLVPKCHESWCTSLEITIDEGPRSLVRRVEMKGDLLPSELEEENILDIPHEQIASADFKESFTNDLLMKLRNEGYLAARVSASYSEAQGSDRELIVDLYRGKPLSFTFRGNQQFTARELLNTIDLFRRKQPFGNNTIRLLIENIERLYRQHGFLFATIHHEETTLPEKRREQHLIDITEGSRITLAGVAFENTDIPEEVLYDELAAASPEAAELLRDLRYPVNEKLRRIANGFKQILEKRGYLNPLVEFDIIPAPDKPEASVVFRFTKGEKLLIQEVHFEGLPKQLSEPEKKNDLSVRKVNRILRSLLEDLHEKGFPEAELATTLQPAKQILIVQVTPGKLLRFGAISLEGNKKIPNRVIRENLSIETDAPWDASKLRQSRLSLLQLGLFSRVEMITGERSGQRQDVLVRVEERGLQTLSLGIGGNSEFGLHLFGEAENKSLFRDGRSIRFGIDTYYDSAAGDISRGVGNVRFINPRIGKSPYAFTEDVSFQRLELSTLPYDLDRFTIATSVYRNDIHKFTFSFGHNFTRENLDNVNPAAIISELDSGYLSLSSLAAQISFDNRDNPLNARQGYLLGAKGEFFSEALGGDANISHLESRAVFLQPIGSQVSRFSYALALRGASAWAFDDTTDVPISQRFFTGGRTSIRGFRENSLGPRGSDGTPVGGDVLFHANQELRYFFSDSASVHLFLDMGNVFLRDRALSTDEFRYGAGVGFRFFSPIGPIGFDIGHPLDEKSGEPSVRFHFSIGSTF